MKGEMDGKSCLSSAISHIIWKENFCVIRKKNISQRFHQQKHVWQTSIDTIYPANKEVAMDTLHSLHFLKLRIILKLFSVE